jgi:hypothetical protein
LSFKHIVHNGRRGRGRIIVLMQPVPITTNVVGSNPVDGAVYSIQYLRNNSTVFEELEVLIVDLMVSNVVLLATPTTLQIQYCYSYSYEIFPRCTH